MHSPHICIVIFVDKKWDGLDHFDIAILDHFDIAILDHFDIAILAIIGEWMFRLLLISVRDQVRMHPVQFPNKGGG